jgi:hypothetical protein
LLQSSDAPFYFQRFPFDFPLYTNLRLPFPATWFLPLASRSRRKLAVAAVTRTPIDKPFKRPQSREAKEGKADFALFLISCRRDVVPQPCHISFIPASFMQALYAQRVGQRHRMNLQPPSDQANSPPTSVALINEKCPGSLNLLPPGNSDLHHVSVRQFLFQGPSNQ